MLETGERVITVGESYDERTLRAMFRKERWSWWSGIDGSLLITGRGHQFSFGVDERRSKPYYLRGLNKGSVGDWTSVSDSMDKGDKRVSLRTLRPVSYPRLKSRASF